MMCDLVSAALSGEISTIRVDLSPAWDSLQSLPEMLTLHGPPLSFCAFPRLMGILANVFGHLPVSRPAGPPL